MGCCDKASSGDSRKTSCIVARAVNPEKETVYGSVKQRHRDKVEVETV
jgi:hypothetical protein